MDDLAPWTRTSFGYLSADRSAFLERGAPVEGPNGGNGSTSCWQVWLRLDDDEVERDGSYVGPRFSPYTDPCRTLSDLTYSEQEGDEVYAHRNDAGSFGEAKVTAAAALERLHAQRTARNSAA